ncbi:transcription factor, contains a PHD finger motif [Mycoemilia scoparia]|uniref:Transcription factor, contains a PHD finger motif n=1 Tax=Mycoemilia scoparia TaxID=417184 RepID=A0A9W8DXF9_9FUNG|nr:transcription factor, contains a PHD finger motif [Mycoemilia scoparia]
MVVPVFLDCIDRVKNYKCHILLGDDFFHFKCDKCNNGQEEIKRYHLSWVDVVHITLFNLTHDPKISTSDSGGGSQFTSAERGPQEYGDGRTYFHYKADVARFIDKYWGYFWTKARGETWINSASSALSTNSTENVPDEGRFESGKAKYNKNGMWGLTDELRLPSSYDTSQQQKTRQIMYNIADDGTLQEIHSGGSGGAKKKRRGEGGIKSANSSKRSKPAPLSYASQDSSGAHALSRGKTKKRKSESKSTWVVRMWPDIDNPPGPVKMSRDTTHTATQVQLDSTGLIMWNDKGYRLAKATHGVDTGTWYYEINILEGLKPEWNLRMGWSQISGDLQAPCGFDYYSYSMRANPPTCFHVAYGFPYGEPIKQHDVLGILIHLPKLDAIERQDIDERKWQTGELYRPFNYTRPESERPIDAPPDVPPLPILRGSEIEYFLNGKSLGNAFQDLYLGKYHPAISSYMGGKIELNFGPNFRFPPPAAWKDSKVRAISELEYEKPIPNKEASSQPVVPKAEAGMILSMGTNNEKNQSLVVESNGTKAPANDMPSDNKQENATTSTDSKVDNPDQASQDKQ